MTGKPGVAVVSLHDAKLPSYREVISVHPLVRSHYRWVPEYGRKELQIILALPWAATLTQRSMIYALRVHPDLTGNVKPWERPLHPCLCHSHLAGAVPGPKSCYDRVRGRGRSR
jgi:hypothetical protein